MSAVSRLTVVFLLAILVTTPVAATATTADSPRITEATFDGSSVAAVDGNTTYLWQSGEHKLSANVTGYQPSIHHTACVGISRPDDSDRELSCSSVIGNGTVNVSFAEWPESLMGPQNVTVTVRRTANESHVVDRQTLEVYVLRRGGDPDGDALSNEREAEIGTEFLSSDTDRDGIPDGAEVNTHGTDPLSNDTDDDGLRDYPEVSAGTNATNNDSDQDGLLDGEEVNEYGTDPLDRDSDGDVLIDSAEVEEYGTDPLSNDTDEDGLSDDTEVAGETNATVADTDGDGLLDGEEVNEYGTDPLDEDSDDDGLTDDAELNVHGTDPLDEDSDDDGLTDGEELNVYGTDPLSADSDGDGLADGAEVNEHGTNPLTRDSDGDFLDDGTEVALGTWPTSVADVFGLGVGAVLVIGLFVYRPATTLLQKTLTAPPSDGAVQQAVDTIPDPGQNTDSELDESASIASVDSVEHEVMTDEDRVLQLLQEYSGPMPQKRVGEKTDWSASKVSRLLSRMDDEGTITKITIGRENIIKLADDKPVADDEPVADEDKGGENVRHRKL